MNESSIEAMREYVLKATLYLSGSQAPKLSEQYRKYVENAPEEWVRDSYLRFTKDQSGERA